MKCIQMFPQATWKHGQFLLALLYSVTNFNDKNCERSGHSKPLKFYNHGSRVDILINPFLWPCVWVLGSFCETYVAISA